MRKVFGLLILFMFSICAHSQHYTSMVMYAPTYENEIESVKASVRIDEEKNSITFYNATYEGDVTNLRIDSIGTRYWTYEIDDVKTYFCTDLDDWHPKILVLDLIQRKNTIKLIYIWDEISIEEFSFVVKEK